MHRRLYDIFVITALVGVLVGVLALLAPFAGALLTALLCAVTFYPMHRWLGRRLPRVRPSLRAAISDLLVLIFFVAPLSLMGWALVQEAEVLRPMLRQSGAAVTELQQGNISEVPAVDQVRRLSSKSLGVSRERFRQVVMDRFNTLLDKIGKASAGVAAGLLAFLLYLLVLLFALFFMFRDGEAFLAKAESLVPLRQDSKDELVSRIRDTVVGVARGWIFTSLIQGAAATIGYLIVGNPAAVVLGVLTAVIGLIPMVGTFGVWIPVALFYFFHGAVWKGVFTLVWGAVVVVALMDTVIRPYLVGKKSDLPLFWLFFAFLGGVEVWGAKGIIIGPILIGMAPVLLEVYRDRYLRGEKSDGLEPALHDGRSGPSKT